MILLDKLSKRFDDGTLAVDNVSLEIPSNELTVLIGPSGCGKTTTLKMINRIVSPTAGKVFIDGIDTSTMDPKKLRRKIGYVIQNIGLFPHMTVRENISTVPRLLKWDKNKIRDRVEQLMFLVGLDPSIYADKLPRELSGGQAQRIGVARALAADPPIVLMDEPFGAVDPLTRVRLQDEFVRIQKELKKTIVFVTHDIDEAIRLSDRIAVMAEGRVVQYASAEEILASPVNKFVHDFMGSDRALKRLSRKSVGDFIESSEAVVISKGWAQFETITESFVWAVDDEERLVGWVHSSHSKDTDSLDEALTTLSEEEILLPECSIKEALSRMLESGTTALPVADKNKKFLGQISLFKIQEMTRSA